MINSAIHQRAEDAHLNLNSYFQKKIPNFPLFEYPLLQWILCEVLYFVWFLTLFHLDDTHFWLF